MDTPDRSQSPATTSEPESDASAGGDAVAAASASGDGPAAAAATDAPTDASGKPRKLYREDFDWGEVIGEGAYGEVATGVDQLARPRTHARSLSLARTAGSTRDGQGDRHHVRRQDPQQEAHHRAEEGRVGQPREGAAGPPAPSEHRRPLLHLLGPRQPAYARAPSPAKQIAL